MIFENEKEISKTQLEKLIEAAKAKFPQFKKDGMVMLKYLPSLYTPEPYANPPRMSCPKSIPLPMISQVSIDGQTKTYRYAKSTTQSSDGGSVLRYNPSHIVVNQQIAITDIELLVFLYNFCPYVEDCLNQDPSKNISLMIEDTTKDAIIKNQSRKVEKQYMDIIYGTGVKTSVLLSLAKTYGLSVGDLKADSEEDREVLINKLDTYVGRSEKKRLALIEAIVQDEQLPDVLNTLDKLKDAEDYGIISYDPMAKNWKMTPMGGEPVVLKANSRSASIETLYNYLGKDKPDVLKSIIDEVTARQKGEQE